MSQSDEAVGRHVEHGATVPDQQVKLIAPAAYPIDKYLSTGHPRIEIATILGEEDWIPEPIMRPEDEIMLKKLQDMLQSTAEDLRGLSSEILSSRQPLVQVMTRPTPLDEEFNEKVHMKEMVDAKFNGRMLVNKKHIVSKEKVKVEPKKSQNKAPTKVAMHERKVNAGTQVNISQDAVIDVHTLNNNNMKPLDNIIVTQQSSSQDNQKCNIDRPSHIHLAYEKHASDVVQNKESPSFQKYVIQEMPSIQIRSQLKEQKVVDLHILPDAATNKASIAPSNSTVIEVNHDDIVNTSVEKLEVAKAPSDRKVVQMPCSESSETTVKSNSESEVLPLKDKSKSFRINSVKSERKLISMQKNKSSSHNQSNKKITASHRVSEEWKKKVNVIYGKPSTSAPQKSSSHSKTAKTQKISQTNSKLKAKNIINKTNILNNAEYVPYSKLTLGGVSVSDIENEIAHVSNKANLPLSPILDKIISSRESSVHASPRRIFNDHESGPFSKSDENLLKEVLDIDRKIKKTLNKDVLKKTKTGYPNPKKQELTSNKSDDEDSYNDDFDEDESSVQSGKTSIQSKLSSKKPEINNMGGQLNLDNDMTDDSNVEHTIIDETYSSDSDSEKDQVKYTDKTYIRGSNLSLKTAVDVFEFVHSVDTQDNATQSNTTQKISLKETQTSPRNEANCQPIHNELWNQASLDASGEVDKLFKLEKDFIKNLIMEEYGDIFELKKSITKPTTSVLQNENKETEDKNIATQPKNTQTSSLPVKSIMTSPTIIKSPFATSNTAAAVQPFANNLLLSNRNQNEEREDMDEAGITVNMSSPRFNLRLPQSSREVLSNLDSGEPSSVRVPGRNNKPSFRGTHTQTSQRRKMSSSESWNEETESDISSLGEVNWRKNMGSRRGRGRMSTASESSTASTVLSSVEVNSENLIPNKSEGEISLGQL